VYLGWRSEWFLYIKIKNSSQRKILTISENNAENIAWFSQYLPVDKKKCKSISVVPYQKRIEN
jgi:hypothetical protein